MSGYMTEEEQLDIIRSWWKKNGKSTLFMVVGAFALAMGWRVYQHHVETEHMRGSIAYEQLQTAVANNDAEMATQQSALLVDNFTDTTYAQLAGLQQAKTNIEMQRLSLAADKLKWVISQSNSEELKAIAKLRLAKIYVAEKQPKKAVDLIESSTKGSFSPLAWAILGDAYEAQGERVKAKAAYKQAVVMLPQNNLSAALIHMKLDTYTVG